MKITHCTNIPIRELMEVPEAYHVDMHIDQILGNELAAAVFDSFLPGMRKRVEDQPMIAGMFCGFTGGCFLWVL